MGKIDIENVSFVYEDVAAAGKTRVCAVPSDRALRDVTLEVPDGQFLCVIGHSGSGKTTLLRLIAGLSRPTAGVLRIDGAPVEGPGLDRAVVFQNYALFPWMSALRNVEFGVEQANKELRRGLSKAQVAGVAREYLDRVGMGVAADKYPYQLSGGMRQRVAIARALAMDAEILLFDEPFGALDVKTRCSLQKLVDSLWRSGERRKTVVFVTHDINEAILLADRVVFMRRGEIVADRAVDVPRTRSSTIFASDPCAMALKDELTELFYLDGDEDEDGFGAPDAEGALGALAGEAGLV
ncbi:ABC transporter ATP-binding protein [Gordonibacter massiliensis (ex Traore et al. 2017)]|uniref:ABC transporter ATP-binding protein n=1 Tax=Gordonibacter massiliensis (ex Traore et al. 2017) TaxID=1841863 RepID=UPI001C8BC37C|nr:ABC transporter ATP-binding protein [Gordonibacter massiliensis (ex Traore et al. 2017)]